MSLLSLRIGSFFSGAVVAFDFLSDLVSPEISITGTATATISRLHVCSGTTSDYTVTLPAASGLTGKFLALRMAPGLTKLVTIDGNGSETIDGALTRLMWADEACVLYCDGSNWFKIAGKTNPMFCLCDQTLATAPGQSIPNNTVTVVDLDTTVVDNTGMMADLANDKILIKRAGTYRIGSAISFFSISSSAVRALNSVSINGGFFFNAECSGLANGFPTPFGEKFTPLSVGDFIQLSAYQNSGSSQNIDGTTGVTFLGVSEVPTW